LVAFKTGMDVRLGLPNQSIQSEVMDEVNQPMFATGFGLLLTGFAEKDSSCTEAKPQEVKKEKKIVVEAVADLIPEPTVIETPVTDKKQGKKTMATLFDNLGKFFEVDDQQM